MTMTSHHAPTIAQRTSRWEAGAWCSRRSSDQLAAQAAGKNEFPQRFVFVVKSSGLTPGHIVPDNFVDDYIVQKESYIAGEGIHQRRADEGLRQIHQPLAEGCRAE